MNITSTGTRGSRALGTIALVLLGTLVAFGFLVSPADEVQGDAVRLMYVHVPSAWLAYLSFFVTFVCSVAYLIPRTRSMAWDRVAAASAEIGVLFTGLALLTGMVWGRITWGVYWTWDARLTSTALLFLLFCGYLALRRLPASFEQRAKRSAILGVIAFVDVPIVHMSVLWWNTLHQDPTILRTDLDPQIDGLMLTTLMLGVVAFTVTYLWLLVHRLRVGRLEEWIESRELEVAIRERLAEAGPTAVTGPPPGADPLVTGATGAQG
jgi:heme exporter protein C